jgi:peptidoglycan/xylan/chitin deacetylase (PgdA/CDA1 family)
MLTLPFSKNACSYRNDSLRIAYYHIVSDRKYEFYFGNKIISPGVFRQHLTFFQKHFTIVSLQEALHMVDNNESLHRKLVLTFDDGFAENYDVVAPILKEEGLNATFFLIGNCIDNKELMWRNKLLVLAKKAGRKLPGFIREAIRIFRLPAMYYYEDIFSWSLRGWPMNRKDEIANYFWNAADFGTVEAYLEEKKPYLTKDQIRCLVEEGFEIGSHSMSHPVFSRLSYEEFQNEVLSSVQLLQTSFKKEITSFSYPFGIKSAPGFEQKLINDARLNIKTLLGTKNTLNNYRNSLQWERDNVAFPMWKMLFRFNFLPLLRRFA